MQRSQEQQIPKRIVPVILLATVFFFLQLGANVHADELVSCRYQQAEGKKISLQLDIGTPPPSMLILIQRIPKGVRITKATPPVKKYNPHKREAKWLLKHLQPGETLFTIELDKEVTADQISGEIRYKNPIDGKMEIMAIKP